MSKTPQFDKKIAMLLDETKLGERVCPISGEKWMLSAEEIERCRKWQVPPSQFAPMTDDELAKLGIPPFDPKAAMRYAPYPKDVPVRDVSAVPDCIHDVDDTWAGVQFEDKEEERQYNVGAAELKFRKEHNYPFPRRHYRARLIDLVRQINSPEREEHACDQCGRVLMVNKNRMYPNRKIYCLSDYLQYLESR